MLCNYLTAPIEYQVNISEPELRADLFTNYETLETVMNNTIVCSLDTQCNASISISMLCYETNNDSVLLLTKALVDNPIDIVSLTVKDGIKLRNAIDPGRYVLINSEGRHNFTKYTSSNVIGQNELHPVQVPHDLHKKVISKLKESFNTGDLKLYQLTPYELHLARDHALNKDTNQVSVLTKRPDDITEEGQFMYRLHIVIVSDQPCKISISNRMISKEYLDAAKKGNM